MRDRSNKLVELRRSLLIGGAVGGAALLSRQAKADTAFTNFAFTGTGSPTSRTTPNRISDVINVMEWGAKGDNSTDDTLAIRAAINAALGWVTPSGANVGGATVFFPPGIYKVSHQAGDATDAAIFELTATNNATRIVGSGMGATKIVGTCNFNMIFNQSYNINGVNEISGMTIQNQSQVIGTGCIRLISTSLSVALHDLDLIGMICLDQGYFMGTSINIHTSGSSAGMGSTPNYGGIGINVTGGNVIGWNTSGGGHQIGLLAGGNTGSVILGCRCEEADTAMQIGQRLGVGTLCTISGSVLTVGGTCYPPSPGALGDFGIYPFNVGDQIIGTGIPATTFVQISSFGTGTGGTGTYNLNVAPGNISSAVPMISLHDAGGPSSTLISGFETEGCRVGLLLNDGNGITVENCDFTGAINEAATVYGSNTSTPKSGVYIYQGQSVAFRNVNCSGLPCWLAGFAFDGIAADHPSVAGIVFDNCRSGGAGTTITTAAAFIDDGLSFPSPSGNPGKILSIPSGALPGTGSFPTVGIQGRISGTGVPTGTATPYIVSELGSPSGTWNPAHQGGANTQYVLSADTGAFAGAGSGLALSARVFTVSYGQAWGSQNTGLSTLTGLSAIIAAQKAGVQILNSDNANSASLQMVFADLPGQAGVAQPLLDGMEYDIFDCQCGGGACTTSSWLTTASGGGTGAAAHRRVRYNATAGVWQVIG